MIFVVLDLISFCLIMFCFIYFSSLFDFEVLWLLSAWMKIAAATLHIGCSGRHRYATAALSAVAPVAAATSATG